MKEESFIQLLQDILEIKEIKLNSKISDISQWDSMTVVALLSAADEMGIDISPDDFDTFVTVNDVFLKFNK